MYKVKVGRYTYRDNLDFLGALDARREMKQSFKNVRMVRG